MSALLFTPVPYINWLASVIWSGLWRAVFILLVCVCVDLRYVLLQMFVAFEFMRLCFLQIKIVGGMNNQLIIFQNCSTLPQQFWLECHVLCAYSST